MSICESNCDNVCLDTFSFTLLLCVFLAGQGVPPPRSRSAEALPLAYDAGALLFITLIILVALIVAAVGGGGLIFVLHLRSILHISARQFPFAEFARRQRLRRLR